MTAEHSPESAIDGITMAQNMTEWFGDYLYGFSDEIGEIPDVTRARLARQFGEGDIDEQLALVRDLLLRAEQNHQPDLGLYFCGFPDNAMDVLSETGLEGTRQILDRYYHPVAVPDLMLITNHDIVDKQLQPHPERSIGSEAIRSVKPTIEYARISEGRDSVQMYLNEIGKIELLSAEREVDLAKTIEAGLFAERLLKQNGVDNEVPMYASHEELEWLVQQGQEAKKQFLEANLRLVASIARKYSRSNMPLLDLIQEGNTGLIRAIEKFDYTYGFKFSTYAVGWINQAIQRGITNKSRVVRLPIHVRAALNKVNSTRESLEADLGREVEPGEIAIELDMTTKQVTDLILWGRDYISLDAPVGEDGETTFGDLIAHDLAPSPDEHVFYGENKEQLQQLIETLSVRSAGIIRRRFGLFDGRRHTLDEIGNVYGISRERVRILEQDALRALRRAGNPDEGSDFHIFL